MKKWIGRILVIWGMSMMAFPFIRFGYGKCQTEKLMDTVEESVMDNRNKNVLLEGSEDVKESKNVTESEGNKDSESTKTSVDFEESAVKHISKGELIGIIEIEKIGIRYPIVEGAGENELRFAVGHVKDTALIGKSGNCVLAGHRGSRYGEFFQKIGELERGDVIQVSDMSGSVYCYEVSEMFVVGVEDVWVLEQGEEDKVTLISCENGGKERLVVVGKRSDYLLLKNC